MSKTTIDQKHVDFDDGKLSENFILNHDDINLDIIPSSLDPNEKISKDFYEIIIIKKYKCKSCEQMFDSFEEIHNHHIIVHKNGNQTEIPKLLFIDSSNIHTSYREKSNKNIDNRSLKNKTKKRSQQPRKSLKRKYPCDWPDCDYVASNSVHLKDHRRIHSGEKPYRCDWNDCGHSFTQLSSLRLYVFN